MTWKQVPCTQCGGQGTMTCQMCQGSGKAPSSSWNLGAKDTTENCMWCKGEGKTNCEWCHGTGSTTKWDFDSRPLSTSTPDFSSQLSDFGANIPNLDTRIKMPQPVPVFKPKTEGIIGPKAEQKPVPGDIVAPLDETSLIALLSVLLLVLVVVYMFGVERTLVAGEAFCIFAGWSAIRFSAAFRGHGFPRLQGLLDWLAVIFSLCGGFLAGYLILTRPEGKALTAWVTAEIVRMIGSLFASILGLGLLEALWYLLVSVLKSRVPW